MVVQQNEHRTLWYLRKLPLLAHLRPDTLSQLADNVTMQDARRRRIIYMPGDPGDTIFFLSSGRVKLSRVTPDGKELTLFYRGPGEFFGEQCLIDGGPREEMAEVGEAARLILVPRQRFETLVNETAAFAAAFALTLCEQRVNLERKMEELIFKDVGSKLAELLLKTAELHGVDDERGTLIGIKITHQEMANLIGSTRETVSLTLSQFKRKGHITTRGRRVVISDKEALQALV